jgi:hypothetical protein
LFANVAGYGLRVAGFDRKLAGITPGKRYLFAMTKIQSFIFQIKIQLMLKICYHHRYHQWMSLNASSKAAINTHSSAYGKR